MFAQENSSLRPQREAKKRAAAAATCELHEKKRVALGELTNFPNANDVVSPPAPQSHKPKSRNVGKSNSKPTAAPAPAPAPDKLDDPQLCGPYISDIYEYLRKMEVEASKRPLTDYIQEVQKDINANMRGDLVDRLVEVAEELKLVSDTLYFSVSYIDRFLSSNVISRHQLPLLGVSSMLIASKYEEIKPRAVEDFYYFIDYAYSMEEVVNMEADILKSLKFELGGPTVKTFLRRFSRVAQEGVDTSNLQFEFLCSYLAELSLLDYNCVKFLPSLVAASVVFLARFMLRPRTHPWNSALHQLTRYIPADLRECVLNIHDLYLSRRGGSLQAVREKYKQHKFKCVATTPSPPEIPLSFFEFGVADS